MSLVRTLVLREADVTVDAEYCFIGIAANWQLIAGSARTKLGDQALHRELQLGVVDLSSSLEPVAFIILREPAQECEGGRAEALKIGPEVIWKDEFSLLARLDILSS